MFLQLLVFLLTIEWKELDYLCFPPTLGNLLLWMGYCFRTFDLNDKVGAAAGLKFGRVTLALPWERGLS